MKLYTIGFTRKNAETFFGTLSSNRVRSLIDVRLNNVSQLAGFTKREDLRYFLKKLCNADYMHNLDLAPTQDLLDKYKKHGGLWSNYEKAFLQLMATRQVETKMKKSDLEQACLLCSEDQPHHCHRRLVAEYLHDRWSDLEIVHL